MKDARGVTLVEILVAAMAAITLLALLIPAYQRSGRHARVVECRGHLQALFKASLTAPPGPAPLGSPYWMRLSKTVPPLVEAATLRCPLAMEEGVSGDCDYLGPAKDPAGLAATEPIGCDAADNHGRHGREGGNVLWKSGEVRPLHPLEPGAMADPWREAWQQKCAR